MWRQTRKMKNSLKMMMAIQDPEWKDESLQKGKPLRWVWKQVNEFKHRKLQNVDEQDPAFRFTDALQGLHNLSDVVLILATGSDPEPRSSLHG